MFSMFFVLTSIVVWIMPVMTIAGAIFRKDLLNRNEWTFLVFFSVIAASYVSYSSWQDRNMGLVPIGKEYLSCQLKSRNEPDLTSFRTVTLDCGGEEKMAKEEFYDAAGFVE
ncbi:hypothetical protein GPJ73_28575 (plasmid) [Klebsiella pneumoniae]|uniref:hypothetical protein n=1 Tax=Klebsiella pneumoniae TaxID=573 RepID=UPI0012F6EC06|nr:hypothetical protein [Klebsiella pneumoniae]QGW94965.1 hypothetical protein GPJ73_28575 [Klebsiella pneumoniae]